VPLKSTAAEDCAAALIAGWIARFGVPAAITSDRGPQYTSAVWAAFTAKLGVHHHMTTAYHPQSNGLVERLHRRLKEALKARLAGASWPDHLPWVLLGLRSSPREDSGLSSAELVYGAPLALPGVMVAAQEQLPEYFIQLFLSRLSSFSPLRPSIKSGPYARRLRGARFVYMRSPPTAPALTPAYRGPYRVLEEGRKSFRVLVGGRPDSISVDRFKPHVGGKTPELADPPRRGRPPVVGTLLQGTSARGGSCSSCNDQENKLINPPRISYVMRELLCVIHKYCTLVLINQSTLNPCLVNIL
jgi:Integrase core domain